MLRKTTHLLAGIVAGIVLLGMLSARVSAAPTVLTSGFSVTTLSNSGMVAPTGLKIAPDGRMFITDLFGSVRIFVPGIGFKPINFGTVAVNASVDRGLLGATFDSDFANNPYFYIHYVGTDNLVRIGRWNAAADIGTNFTVIYTAPTPSGTNHAGGGIVSTGDGKILFGIGDSGTPTNAQDMTNIYGKIHRVNRDGTVPSNNPFFNQAGTPNTIFASGVRNPFRMEIDSATGLVYLGDVGFNTWEEVNLIQSGKNYGWPTAEGPCAAPCTFENPVYWYQHQFPTSSLNTNDASIVSGPVYRGSLYPASFVGKMFVSDYVQGFLRTVDPGQTSSNFSTLSIGNGAVIDMDVGPDGKLYFVTISSPTIYRLDYTGGATNNPPIAIASAPSLSGPAPLTVNFSSSGSSDPEGQPLSYVWYFGDGTISTSSNPVKTYANNGQYTVSVTVSDGTNYTPSNSLTVRVGNVPTVSFTSPLPTQKYKAGDTISYSVNAAAANGTPITGTAIQTSVILNHSSHTHPFAGPLSGASNSFIVPKLGETSPDVWLTLTATATDANGVTASKSLDIQPIKSSLTVTTSPAGMNVVLDGSNHIVPPTIDGVAGMTRSVSAPSPQIFNSQQYIFDRWSDGGAQTHSFDFPTVPTTLTAMYVLDPNGTTSSANIMPNPSFEITTPANKPANWTFTSWGTNNASLTSETSAPRTGSKYARLQTTSYTNGEGKAFSNPVNVTPNTVHNVQYYYRSAVQTKAVADVTLNDNSHVYVWLGINWPMNDWTERNWTFTTPANAKQVSIQLLQIGIGSVDVDDISLTYPTQVTPTGPVVSLSASPQTITQGSQSTISWSSTGASVTCTAGNGWSGALLPSGTQLVSPAATTTYSVTCTNSGGSDTESVTVTVNPVVPPPPTGNIVPNPSNELEDVNGNATNWLSSRWGVNTAVFSHEHGNAFDGDHSLKIALSGYTSGDASWKFTPQPVQPNTAYTYSQYYKSSGPTKVLVDILLTGGGRRYIWLGSLANTTGWTEFKKTFTTPADAATVTVGAYVTGNGFIQIDQVSLAPTVVATAPLITLSASPSTILVSASTTLQWSVAGSPVACTSSDGWSGPQPISGSLLVSPVVTTTYTLTCSNPSGPDTKSITVVVNQPVNIIQNGTLFTSFPLGAIPTGWLKGSWGSNTVAYAVETNGYSDSSSVSVSMTNYVSGDAKWIFEPVLVTAGASYTFSDYYKSTAESDLLVEFTDSSGAISHLWLGNLATATTWTQVSKTIVVPSGVVKMTVHHRLLSGGVLQTDDYAITLQ